MPSLRHALFIAAALAGPALVAPMQARATQIQPQSIEVMTFRSDAVVRCVPVAGTRASSFDPQGLIVTTQRFQVLETLSSVSPLPPEITIKVLGGTVGDETMLVASTADFVEGEEVVVFLYQDGPSDEFMVLDLSSGKFEITFDQEAGTQYLTRRDFGDIDVGGFALRGEGRGPVAPPRLLEELRERVRAADVQKQEVIRRGQDPLRFIAGSAAIIALPVEEGTK